MEHNHVPKEPVKKKNKKTKKKTVAKENKEENAELVIRNSSLLEEVNEVLEKLKQKYPQYDLNGQMNI